METPIEPPATGGESLLQEFNHEYLMGIALERARSEVRNGRRPIYCLVVKEDGQIAGEAGNTAAQDFDPSAHAEVNAIRNACLSLKTINLSGYTLYTPMEPCPMCLSTILEARISRLVLGARHKRVGRTDLGSYSVESLVKLMSRDLQVVLGVKEAECEDLRLTWRRSLGQT